LRALREVAAFVVHTDERVRSLQPRRDSVTVTTASGRTLDADVVVDCAGPDALALLDDPPPVAAPPSLPQVAYFGPAPGATPEERPPIFIEWGADMIYGLPVPEGGARGGTYKVSHHTPGTALGGDDPAGTAPLEDDPGLLALLTGAVRRLLPSLDPDPVHTERCVYDNSADTDFILARTGRIVVGCGTSGHGFKFGPLLGELLADLADGATPSIDLRPFGLQRDPAPPHRPAHHSR
jgi:sarcosine oxidase